MTFRRDNSLPASSLRILGVVLQNAEEGRSSTVRGIARQLGMSGYYYVFAQFHRLRDAGLVDFDGAGTIHPTCLLMVP